MADASKQHIKQQLLKVSIKVLVTFQKEIRVTAEISAYNLCKYAYLVYASIKIVDRNGLHRLVLFLVAGTSYPGGENKNHNNKK